MEHTQATCLGFGVDCDVLWKGIGVFVAGSILFIGSVYVVLAAVFGRWMGYLVLMVSFTGWMILLSSLWLFGYWAQGSETPTNLGPRGSEPAWTVIEAGSAARALEAAGETHKTFTEYPQGQWANVPDPTSDAYSGSILSAGGAATSFLAEHTNEELGVMEGDPGSVSGTSFIVDDVRFADSEDGKTSLAIVEAHYAGGGPAVTLALYHDSGSVPRYSFMFLLISIVLFVIHLSLMDRAERKRKEFLTGGTAPAWYGPA